MPPQNGCLGTLRLKTQVHVFMDIKFLICQKFFYIINYRLIIFL